MIKFITGDIFESPAECLVNTVNCEGFMGKGVAYQFKVKFPENEKAYALACKNKNISIGNVFCFKENNLVIANFPTKDKWRASSQYHYIELGMDDLVAKIKSLNIKSIALPPLGCGNGGLEWSKVKSIILQKIADIETEFDFYIYEPSKNYIQKPVAQPKLTASHLILMKIKLNLKKVNRLRLQKAAFIMNIVSEENYFKFDDYKFGPYSHSIEVISKQIKEYQDHNNFSTNEALDAAMKSFISSSVLKKINLYESPIIKSTSFINSFQSDKDLETSATILSIVKSTAVNTMEDIVNLFLQYPKQDITRFSKAEVEACMRFLLDNNFIYQDMYSYKINTLVFNAAQ